VYIAGIYRSAAGYRSICRLRVLFRRLWAWLVYDVFVRQATWQRARPGAVEDFKACLWAVHNGFDQAPY
jgi:hypothetical protein